MCGVCEGADFPLAESLRVWLAKPGDRKALPLKALSKAKHYARCVGRKTVYQIMIQSYRIALPLIE